MLSLASQLVARAARLFFAATGEPARWAVSGPPGDDREAWRKG
jgi:hypothetical protein